MRLLDLGDVIGQPVAFVTGSPEELRELAPLLMDEVRIVQAEGDLRTCRECGCSAVDCTGCVERTGQRCWWVEPDLCSACLPAAPPPRNAGEPMLRASLAARAREVLQAAVEILREDGRWECSSCEGLSALRCPDCQAWCYPETGLAQHLRPEGGICRGVPTSEGIGLGDVQIAHGSACRADRLLAELGQAEVTADQIRARALLDAAGLLRVRAQTMREPAPPARRRLHKFPTCPCCGQGPVSVTFWCPSCDREFPQPATSVTDSEIPAGPYPLCEHCLDTPEVELDAITYNCGCQIQAGDPTPVGIAGCPDAMSAWISRPDQPVQAQVAAELEREAESLDGFADGRAEDAALRLLAEVVHDLALIKHDERLPWEGELLRRARDLLTGENAGAERCSSCGILALDWWQPGDGQRLCICCARHDAVRLGRERAAKDLAARGQKKAREVDHAHEDLNDWSLMPEIVCLCGSTRFMDEFHEAGWRETLAGRIVLSVGVSKHLPRSHGGESLGAEVAAALDELHLRKIDLADQVLVLNVDGYICDSTRREVEYAQQHGKLIRWLVEPA